MIVARFTSALRSLSADDHRLWRVLDDSIVGRAMEGFSAAAGRAAPDSIALTRFRQVRRQWQDLPVHESARLAGIAVLTAVIVHVGLVAFAAPVGPTGAWWLIVPGMAAAFGAAALAVGASNSKRDGRAQ